MVTKTLDDLAESFGLFDNWEDRYRYLIELGERLPPFDESQKTEENFVKGCTSRVWLVAEMKNGKLHFTAESDAQIVNGLIYLLIITYQDKTSEEIDSFDIEAAFKNLGLDQHLSPNRRNGFFAMVERIKILSQL